MLLIMRFILIVNLITVIWSEQWDIYDLIDSLGCHNYASALQSTGPMYNLGDNGSGPYTVFAPTDDAFQNVPDYVAKIFNFGNWRLAYDIVTFHIIYGNISLNQFYNEMLLPTWQGEQLRFNVYNNLSGEASYYSPNGGIVQKTGQATNGMVYVIDRVLYNLPRIPMDMYVQEQRNLSQLQMLMVAAGVQQLLRTQNLTLLAPSNAAFDKVPGLMRSLIGNETLAKELFKNHLVNTTYFSVGLIDGLRLTNANNQQIAVKNNGSMTCLTSQ